MRSRRSSVPVLVATARDGVTDRIVGLDAGTGDYAAKPCDTDELLARVRAPLRLSAGRGESGFQHKGVSLNPATHEATVNGQMVLLSAREWAVLEPLLARPGVVLSRTQLEEKLFSWNDDISSSAVWVCIHGVRKMLGNDISQTVRGLGYLAPKEWRPNKTVHPIHPQRTPCAAGFCGFYCFQSCWWRCCRPSALTAVP